MKSLGQLIAARRKELGLTQAELAALLHISVRTLNEWEHDRSTPAPEKHELLTLVLNWETSIGDILEGWEPWNSTGGLKSGGGPRAYWEAPPGQEETWHRAREKADRAIEALSAPPKGKKADAKTT